MFVKLAVRNVKRQLTNYLIYFVTVTLTVSMMFALCNLIFSDQLLGYASKIEELQGGLIWVAVAVSVIVSLVLGYASSFMLKLRKREFGTYLTLGMKRRSILIMFTVENLLIGLVSLGCGILFGLLLYQGMVGLVARALDLHVALGSYSFRGLLLTVGLTAATFLLSIVSSMLYLRKTTVYELLHAEKKVNGSPKHPLLWMLVTLVSFAGLVAGIAGIYGTVKTMLAPNASDAAVAAKLFVYFVLVAASVVFFHIGAASSAVYLLLKRPGLKAKGTNTFLLRQLSGQLHANAVLCGIIALLITAAVLCTNVCFTQKATSSFYLDHDFPFDVSIDLTQVGAEAPYDCDSTLQTVEAYAPIAQRISYRIYTGGNGYLHSFTPWTGTAYESLFDSFITESDFHRLMSALGYDPVSLGKQFLVLSTAAGLAKCDFSDAKLVLGGEEYTLLEATDRYPKLATCYFLTVIPDAAAAGMTVESETMALRLGSGNYDAQALHDRFSYTVPSGQGYLLQRCPVTLRAYHELEENSLTAILIVGELYAAIIFVFLATAILTMKVLAELAEDRRRYALLYQLGADRRARRNTLFRQTFAIFAFPFFLPLLLCIPAADICGRIVRLGGYGALTAQINQNAVLIAAILVLIQLLYFCATYATKKHIC